MKIIRYADKENHVQYGWLNNDLVGKIEGDIFGEFRRLEADTPLDRVRLLPPVIPSKIIAIGRNYAAHAAEHQADVPTLPLIFLKPPSSLIGQNEPIILPPQSNHIEHEAELTVVISQRTSWTTPEKAKESIFGYTLANDVSARDLQFSDGQWARAKGFDTFCPLGPWIDTTFDPADAIVSCRVNGELRQMSSTREMVFDVNHLVAYISTIMTLEAGDIILTGTPAGVSPIQAGDVVDVEVEGLGVLSNPVKTRN